jgi:predicted short-subunit dehydrogenase-like oxidoreductase (DUF2520 family)
MKVVLIGSGNVAAVLGLAMIQAGHTIVQVYSRQARHAAELAQQLGAAYCSSLETLQQGADVYIIAVTDTALPVIAGELQLGNSIVVHTSGSGGIELLRGCSSRYGVLYPLQSLRKEVRPLPVIPLLVEGSDGGVEELLLQFARSVSPLVMAAGSAQRLKLHLSAVFVSNFTNYLYTLAEAYCREQGLDFRYLVPLIKETAGRIEYASPANVQTGPAIRNDEITIRKHLDLLQHNEPARRIYALLTEAIRERFVGN